MKKPRIVVIIPARLESSRLPGKVLMDIQGKTMLNRVHERAVSIFLDEDVFIATDSEEIKKTAESFKAQVVMTRKDHESGTQRIAEAVKILKLDDEDIVVNLQGDEPEIPVTLLQLVAKNLLHHKEADIATLYEHIKSEAEFYNPNVVKVVTNHKGHALYFSREPIPHHGFKEGLSKRHLGLYAYRVRTLKKLSSSTHSSLERAERLEQLQTLYDGGIIHVGPAPYGTQPGIDTQEDLDRARKAFR